MTEVPVLIRPVELLLPCGRVALVSAEDWPRVSKLSWSHKGNGYVHASFKKRAGGDGRMVSLHRFIMSPPADMVVDHIDSNPLNNTRENLQIVTQSRNAMRRRDVLRGGIQKYRDRWRVRISVDGVQKSFGLFGSRDEAETALALARAEAWGGDANQFGAQL